MSDVPDRPELPVIRAARLDDYPHYVDLFPSLGVPEDPPSAADWQAGQMARALIAETPGEGAGARPVGYAFYDLMPGCGYVRNIMVAGDQRRRGYGRALMAAMADIFRAAGCTEWRLNVKRDNHAAVALYQRCGLDVSYPTAGLRLPFALADRLPAPSPTLRVEPLPPEDDRAAERQFAMPAGLLTSLRTRPGDHLLQLMDDSRSPPARVGVARFSPGLPGAFPIRVRAPAMVRPLLETFRALTPADVDTLLLTCEDDPALIDTLRSHGAELVMEVFHMRGELP